MLFTLGGFSAIMPKLTNRMADLITDYVPEPGMLSHEFYDINQLRYDVGFITVMLSESKEL